MRPPSILLFERLYLAAFVVSVVFAVANWSGDVAALLTEPTIARIKGADRIIGFVYPAMRVLIWAGWLLLWWLVARRGSGVGRVLVTIAALFAAYDGVGVLLALLSQPLSGWGPTGTVIEAALLVSAAAMLWRPDARAWIAEGGTEQPTS